MLPPTAQRPRRRKGIKGPLEREPRAAAELRRGAGHAAAGPLDLAFQLFPLMGGLVSHF